MSEENLCEEPSGERFHQTLELSRVAVVLEGESHMVPFIQVEWVREFFLRTMTKDASSLGRAEYAAGATLRSLMKRTHEGIDIP
jgi:hypothetical protein